MVCLPRRIPALGLPDGTTDRSESPRGKDPMQSLAMRLLILAGVVGVGFLVMLQAQQGINQSQVNKSAAGQEKAPVADGAKADSATPSAAPPVAASPTAQPMPVDPSPKPLPA